MKNRFLRIKADWGHAGLPPGIYEIVRETDNGGVAGGLFYVLNIKGVSTAIDKFYLTHDIELIEIKPGTCMSYARR